MSRLLDTIRMAIYVSRMTIQEICTKTGLSKNTVSSLKQGSKSNVGTPLLSTVLEVLDAIGYRLTVTTGDTNEKETVDFPLNRRDFFQNYITDPQRYWPLAEANLDYETIKKIANDSDRKVKLRTLIVLTSTVKATVSVEVKVSAEATVSVVAR